MASTVMTRDLHVELRAAKAAFGTPAAFAADIARRVDKADQFISPELSVIRADLEILAYWLATTSGQ